MQILALSFGLGTILISALVKFVPIYNWMKKLEKRNNRDTFVADLGDKMTSLPDERRKQDEFF